MADFRAAPERASYLDGLLAAGGDALVAVFAFGEPVRVATWSGPSELLVIANALDAALVARLREHHAARAPHAQVELKLFTLEEFQTSLDVFPVEAHEVSASYQLLHGRDILRDIEIHPANLRHQLEFELRSKKQILLATVLVHDETSPEVGRVMLAFARDFVRLGRHYLALNGKTDVSTEAILGTLASDPGIDAAVLEELSRIATGGKRPTPDEKRNMVWRFIDQVDRLIRAIDRTGGHA